MIHDTSYADFMAAISLDLRKRILEALSEDSSSLRVGRRFSVSPSFVRKLRIQVRQTGDPAPGKAPGKERLVKGATERRLRKLAANSPDFNPIEPAWSKTKAILRRLGARTWRRLVNAVGDALHAITPQTPPVGFATADTPLRDPSH